jgi:hypothetical protein
MESRKTHLREIESLLFKMQGLLDTEQSFE